MAQSSSSNPSVTSVSPPTVLLSRPSIFGVSTPQETSTPKGPKFFSGLPKTPSTVTPAISVSANSISSFLAQSPGIPGIEFEKIAPSSPCHDKTPVGSTTSISTSLTPMTPIFTRWPSSGSPLIRGYPNYVPIGTVDLEFDADGDLFLDIGPAWSAKRCRVCSRTLSRASPVWEKMLYGNFVERKPDDKDKEWVVAFPEEDLGAMKVIFSILHAKFDQVPRNPDTTELFKITVVTDKFNLTHILRPWAKAWVQNQIVQFDKWLPSLDLYLGERFLWIAWELGSRPLFNKAWYHFVLNTAFDTKGEIYHIRTGAHRFYPHFESIGISEQLKAAQVEMLTKLWTVFEDRQNQLTSNDAEVVRKNCSASKLFGPNTTPQDRETCARYTLGCFTYELGLKNMYPPAIQAHVRPLDTISKLGADFKAICRKLKPMPGMSMAHSFCNPGPNMEREINLILKNIPPLTSERHLNHLREQAKKIDLA